MVHSDANGPPQPLPIDQAPAGQMIQQIVDEQGTLTHVIISPKQSTPAAAFASHSPMEAAHTRSQHATPQSHTGTLSAPLTSPGESVQRAAEAARAQLCSPLMLVTPPSPTVSTAPNESPSPGPEQTRTRSAESSTAGAAAIPVQGQRSPPTPIDEGVCPQSERVEVAEEEFPALPSLASSGEQTHGHTGAQRPDVQPGVEDGGVEAPKRREELGNSNNSAVPMQLEREGEEVARIQEVPATVGESRAHTVGASCALAEGAAPPDASGHVADGNSAIDAQNGSPPLPPAAPYFMSMFFILPMFSVNFAFHLFLLHFLFYVRLSNRVR